MGVAVAVAAGVGVGVGVGVGGFTFPDPVGSPCGGDHAAGCRVTGRGERPARNLGFEAWGRVSFGI